MRHPVQNSTPKTCTNDRWLGQGGESTGFLAQWNVLTWFRIQIFTSWYLRMVAVLEWYRYGVFTGTSEITRKERVRERMRSDYSLTKGKKMIILILKIWIYVTGSCVWYSDMLYISALPHGSYPPFRIKVTNQRTSKYRHFIFILKKPFIFWCVCGRGEKAYRW